MYKAWFRTIPEKYFNKFENAQQACLDYYMKYEAPKYSAAEVKADLSDFEANNIVQSICGIYTIKAEDEEE